MSWCQSVMTATYSRGLGTQRPLSASLGTQRPLSASLGTQRPLSASLGTGLQV
ncbi:MAG: hypothetical protein HEQ35_03800 [Gloeotrichia echinulata IR180]|nr:hypothetical protein [Gloeotrichia echinulata DEX184]